MSACTIWNVHLVCRLWSVVYSPGCTTHEHMSEAFPIPPFQSSVRCRQHCSPTLTTLHRIHVRCFVGSHTAPNIYIQYTTSYIYVVQFVFSATVRWSTGAASTHSLPHTDFDLAGAIHRTSDTQNRKYRFHMHSTNGRSAEYTRGDFVDRAMLTQVDYNYVMLLADREKTPALQDLSSSVVIVFASTARITHFSLKFRFNGEKNGHMDYFVFFEKLKRFS